MWLCRLTASPNEALDVAIDEAIVADMLCTANAARLALAAVDTGVDYPELVESQSCSHLTCAAANTKWILAGVGYALKVWNHSALMGATAAAEPALPPAPPDGPTPTDVVSSS